ncbi:aspartate kinase [Hymenobacter sp. IS2118]|uniref:aspartate kinase n=1 Tax=Hymenobacter sp. IS2118 TaxID=1505605 RepID=UPI00068B5905|nr:aspartate kinase [Hymenobacter sp. IS2118]
MEEAQGIQVYKFGGASVKDAAAILNLCRIVRDFGPQGPLVIVVSAMGKTTNALEEIYDLAYRGADYSGQFSALATAHRATVEELMRLQLPKEADVNTELVEEILAELADALVSIDTVWTYDQGYDQIVSYGERLSVAIVTGALANNFSWNEVSKSAAKELITTNENWREGQVDWVETAENIKLNINQLVASGIELIVTEGFIGGTNTNFHTTLGREGSDYTAAILAYCLRAESVTIWKDVAGLLNADPKLFPDTVRYPEISYRETIEMAYYGASVIHPKTLKPLADRNIPLRVKSFLDPAAEGTLIHDCQHPALAPAFIRKTEQCLISFESKDFAFVSEENLEVIFGALAQARLKINLMQNSAISFSVCTDFSERRVHQLLDLLREQFTLHYNTGLTLFTIKNYDAASITRLTAGKRLLLEQRTRNTFQFVCQ